MKYICRNVKFDNSYSNSVLFTSLSDKLEYFDIPANYEDINSPEINFNYGNLLNTTLVLKDTNAYGVLSLLNYNYIILVEELNETPYKYLFYFINDIKYDTHFQVTLSLELDVLTTFSLYDLEFSPCVIHRIHLDRFSWKTQEDDYGEYKIGSIKLNNYDLYNNEPTSYSKVLTKRTHLKMAWTGNREVDEWLNEYVGYWVYCFVDKSHSYYELKGVDSKTNTGPMNISLLSPIDPNREYGCFCYPVLKNDGIMRFENGWVNDVYVRLSYLGEEGFRDLNNDTSYYYSKKYSIVPPWVSWLKNGKVSGNTLTLTWFSQVSTWTYYLKISEEYKESTAHGVITYVNTDAFEFDTKNYSTQFPVDNVIISDPINYKRQIKLEPKLYSNLIKDINICYQGNTFTYDPLKIGDSVMSFKYTEVIQPEITKIYYRLNASNLYSSDTENSYLGLVASVDNSLPYANDQYAEYLANNKNFWLQTTMKVGSNLIQGGIQSFASGSPTSIIGSAISGATSFANAGLKADNMKNSPDSLSNANGSYLFSLATGNYDLVVEEYEALQDDKEKAYDYLYMNGYIFEKIGNIKDYINTRYYFNYISADLDNIYYKYNLSLPIRNKLKSIFKNGVRLWHYHKEYKDRLFNYDYENFEKGIFEE